MPGSESRRGRIRWRISGREGETMPQKKTTREEVIVAIQPKLKGTAFDAAVEKVTKAGLKQASVKGKLNIVMGTIDSEKVAALRALKEVVAVDLNEGMRLVEPVPDP